MSRSTPPEPAWTTPAKVVYVIDGDTVVVDVTRRLRIRVLDCWAPESRTRDLDEKHRGLAAKENMCRLLPVGSPVTVSIPTSIDGDVQDVLTMGRFLAHVWSADGVNVADAQFKAGHATREKS